jgi:hypothetical protein
VPVEVREWISPALASPDLMLDALWFAGGSVVPADGFSASGFWDDVVRFDCTLFQCIGELCRYLLKAAPSEFRPRSSGSMLSCETFKQKKRQLIHDGFDPTVVADPLYVRDLKSGAYRWLDRAVRAQLVEGSMLL